MPGDYHLVHFTLDLLKLLELEDDFKDNEITDERIANDRDNCGLEIVIPNQELQSQFINHFDMVYEAANAESSSGSEDDEPSSKIPRIDPSAPEQNNTQNTNEMVQATPMGFSICQTNNTFMARDEIPNIEDFDDGSSSVCSSFDQSTIHPSQEDLFENSVLDEDDDEKDESKGIKPIQILKIKDSAVILEDVLSFIFGKNPNRKIGVICIAGEIGKGKSFFMNYVLRYLKWSEEHKDHKTSTPYDLFHNKYENVPCEGFSWGKNKGTKGIWMWPKPFSFKTENDGEEIDIFVMDTQGISTSTLNLESASIFGFSLIASSFLILNTQDFTKINEKIHDHLDYFTNFMKKEENIKESSSSHLQKLLLLIRDWKKPAAAGELNNNYGPMDSEEYLNSIFTSLSEKQQEQEKKFLELFSDLNVVVLPHPGEESLKPESNGSIQELSKHFVDILRRSIYSEFDPTEKIPAKQFKGDFINGPQLVNLLTKFVSSVNNSLIKSVNLDQNKEISIYNRQQQKQQENDEPNSKSSCETLLNTFKILVKKQWPSDQNTFLTSEQIEKLFEFTSDAVHRMFCQLFSPVSDQQKVQDNLKILSDLIDLEKEKIRGENNKRKIAAEKMMKNEIENFAKSYELKVESHFEKNKSLILLSDENLQKLNNSIKEEILTDFKSKFNNILFPSAFEELSTKIESRSSELISSFSIKRSKQSDEISIAREAAIKKYKNALDEFLGISTQEEEEEEEEIRFFEEAILLSKHQQERSFSRDFIKQFFETLSPSLNTSTPWQPLEIAEQLEAAQNHVLSEIDKLFEFYLSKNQQRKQLFISQVKNHLIVSEDSYRNKMKIIVENCFDENSSILNETEFINKEKSVRISVLEEFKNLVCSKFRYSELLTKFKEELKNEMSREFETVFLPSFKLKEKENELEMKRVLFSAKLFYNEQMNKQFTNDEDSFYMKPEKLNNLHEEIVAATLCNFQQNSNKNYNQEENAFSKLTPHQEKQVKETLKLLFRKYEEENLRRFPDEKNPSIGIDLGFTNSCVCVYSGNRTIVIPNENGKNTTPSFVHFSEDGSVVVGDAAKQLASQHPSSTVFGVKRLIGRKFSQIEEDVKKLPFEVVGVDDVPFVRVRGKNYNAEEICALILKKMKNVAEIFLDVTIQNCVITVPAQFNDAMRQATKDAAEIAGLNVLALLNEPTSSAFSYQLHRKDEDARNVVVFDLGGGTLDVAVLKINQGEIKVETVQGDNNLGGEDFDRKMVEFCVEMVKKNHGVELSKSQLRKLAAECEEQKKVLSSAKTATVSVDLSGDETAFVKFTREDFEKMNAGAFETCIEIVEKALNEVQMNKTEVEDIILIGGSTRIPKIQKLLIDYFGKTLSTRINADEAVARGASFHAALITGRKMLEESSVFGTPAVKKLIDVANFNIGIETHNKKLSVIIPKNSVLPCEFVKTYYTIHDNQARLRFNIYEGEKGVAAENNLLGSFRVFNIPVPSKKAKDPIDVTLTLDVEGILTAKAVRRGDEEISNQVLVTAIKGRMDQEQIERAKARIDQHFSIKTRDEF